MKINTEMIWVLNNKANTQTLEQQKSNSWALVGSIKKDRNPSGIVKLIDTLLSSAWLFECTYTL